MLAALSRSLAAASWSAWGSAGLSPGSLGVLGSCGVFQGVFFEFVCFRRGRFIYYFFMLYFRLLGFLFSEAECLLVLPVWGEGWFMLLSLFFSFT